MFSKIELAAALLFAAFYLPSICKAQALQWQVNKTEEIIFGQTDIELICSGTACCAGNPREWIGGPSSISIMRDGTPSDAAKYKETLNTGSFSLIIKALELKDVKVQYQCVIDFDSSPSTELIPTEDVFRYVPDVNSDIEIVKNFNGSNIYLRANLTRVFPVPLCTAFFEETNITSSMVLTTSENEPIKYTVIEMNSISYQCDSNEGSLVISCYVGSISFTVFQENLCGHTSTLLPTTKKPPVHKCFFGFMYVSKKWCIALFVMAMLLIVGFLLLLIYCIFRCRNGNRGIEAGIMMEKQHLNNSNKTKESERFEAKEEKSDDKSSEGNTRKGERNGDQSRSTTDVKESNSLADDRSVNKSKQSNEITHDESAIKTDM